MSFAKPIDAAERRVGSFDGACVAATFDLGSPLTGEQFPSLPIPKSARQTGNYMRLRQGHRAREYIH